MPSDCSSTCSLLSRYFSFKQEMMKWTENYCWIYCRMIYANDMLEMHVMHHNLHFSEFSFSRLYRLTIKLQISTILDLRQYDSNDSKQTKALYYHFYHFYVSYPSLLSFKTRKLSPKTCKLLSSARTHSS